MRVEAFNAIENADLAANDLAARLDRDGRSGALHDLEREDAVVIADRAAAIGVADFEGQDVIVGGGVHLLASSFLEAILLIFR